ncbi:glycosyltransferase [bacterium]|nr:glycosyltransferase [bacterium]
MNHDKLDIVMIGLTITSSWGDGHALTYRGLVRELCARGHGVLFLERDAPWYASHRDLPEPPYGRTALYGSLEELKDAHGKAIRQADVVLVGSYVPDGIAVCDWVLENATGLRIFYDIDTPITLAAIDKGECDYIEPRLIPQFDLYFSFTGGRVMEHIERVCGAQRVRPLHCSVDDNFYMPLDMPKVFDMGYMGTYCHDRQAGLEQLLIEPARREMDLRFIVAGPMYPQEIAWPRNVMHVEHIAPDGHAAFFNSLRFALNVTHAEMLKTGYSPSVHLFEAAACGVPIITDPWDGLDSFFEPGSEILVSRSPEETLKYLTKFGEPQRQEVARRARQRVLSENTARHRAFQFEQYVREAMEAKSEGLSAAG